MTDATANGILSPGAAKPHLDHKPSPVTAIVFCTVLALGLGYGLHGLIDDIQAAHEPVALGVFALLGLALLIALGFEFVNGFHDTANAVATVIYTHSLPPVVAVVWSGFFNFIGVLTSTGVVAYSIITLLPVELILQVGSGAGYAMIFALLLAPIRISMIRPMPFWPSLEPWAKDTPVQVRINRPRIHHGGGASLLGSW